MVRKQRTSPKSSKKQSRKFIETIKRRQQSIIGRSKAFAARRPHRSFRRTLRRDYKRSLSIPGYWALTTNVARLLWSHKRLFGLLVLFYAVLSFLFVGLASQVSFSQLQQVIDETSGELFNGGWGEISRAGLLLTSGILGSFTPELSEAEQIYSGLLVLLVWLTTVWLLRSIYAGSEPRLRDGLYSAGSPIVATALIAIYMILQTLPLILAVLIISSVGLLGGAISLVFWAAAILLITLSVYWLTGSFMALIVVTLPGMYPWRAIQIAGDMVVGRRLRILIRIIWLLVSVLLVWSVLVLPTILLNSWLAEQNDFFDNIPLVPFVMLGVTSLSTVWTSAYIYVLYRKVVDDDEKPA